MREAWIELGAQLEFSREEGVPAVKRQILLEHGLEPGEEEQLPAMMRMAFGLLDQLAGHLGADRFVGVLSGKHRGQPFHVFPKLESGEHGTWCVRVRHPFSRPLGLGLFVYEERFFSRLGKLLFRTQDIQLGNPELDRLVMVKGRDPAGVQAFLSGEALQEELVQLFSLGDGFGIHDWGLQYEQPGETITRARATQVMDAMAAVARLLPEQ